MLERRHNLHQTSHDRGTTGVIFSEKKVERARRKEVVKQNGCASEV